MVSFPTSLDRLKHARTLADGGPPHPYRTRSVLSARWNDDFLELRSRAHELYDLKNTADYHIGQTVLNFVGCSPQDLKSLRTDNPKAIYFEAFAVASNDDEAVLSHTFSPPAAEFYKAESVPMGAKALNATTSFVVERVQRVLFDPTNGLDIRPAYDFPTDVPVLSTTTCLEYDSRLYEQTKLVDDSTLVFGNARAFKILELVTKYAGRDTESAFREMHREGVLSPDSALPDLQRLGA